MKRISGRLGFTKQEDPEKIERGSDEGTSERPLDSLQYSDYPVWEDDLHGEKPKVWGLFLAKYCKEYKIKGKV